MTRGDPIVVVGAGLAGLSCAAALHAAGRDVRVLEASDAVGGRVRTDVVDGFRLDRGFQVLLTAYPEAHRQLDLDALDLCRFETGAVAQFGERGSIVADPFRSWRRLLRTSLSPALTPADKARLALLRRRLRRVHPADLLRGPDEDTGDALRQAGFSERSIERFFAPLIGGIQLDPGLHGSRRMFEIIFRMLADADAAVPALGMQRIPEQLAARLPSGTVELGARVRTVSRGVVETDDGSITASDVVVACDGPTAAALLGMPAVASRSAGAVYFAADGAPIDERLVVLNGRGGPLLNAAVMSNVAPSYAPPGRHLVVGAFPAHTGDDLERAARATFREWWGPAVDRWEHIRTYRITHAQPEQRPPLSPMRSTRVDDGLHVCGDHRDTASIQGALFSGRRCAASILAADATSDQVSGDLPRP
jgi:phytoene dehydrogenase-like protein